MYLCSIYLVIKIVLFCLLLIQLKKDYEHQSPCSSIQEIRWNDAGCYLVNQNGVMHHYEEASVLIHNVLFQLIELTHKKTKKIIILFNDQIPQSQLHFIRLKTTIT